MIGKKVDEEARMCWLGGMRPPPVTGECCLTILPEYASHDAAFITTHVRIVDLHHFGTLTLQTKKFCERITRVDRARSCFRGPGSKRSKMLNTFCLGKQWYRLSRVK